MSVAQQPWTDCFVSHVTTAGTPHLMEVFTMGFNASGIISINLLI